MFSKAYRSVMGIGATGRKAPEKQESVLAGEMGGKVHRRSGAGLVKWDGSSEKFLWDAKHTDGDRVALPRGMLRQIARDALASGRVAFFELEFSKNPEPRKAYVVQLSDLRQFPLDVAAGLCSNGSGSSVSFSRAFAAKLNASERAERVDFPAVGWSLLNHLAFCLFRRAVDGKAVKD